MGTRNIYRSIVEQVPDGVYIISRGKFSYVNEAFERLTRVSRKDLPAPIFDYLDSIHPADREVLRKRRETAKSGKGPPARFQIRVISEDGTVRHLEFNTAPLSDLPDTVLGIIRDVTEAKTKEAARKRQERHFRAVIEAAEEPIVIIQDSFIRYVNPALARLSGFSRKRLVGKPFQDFVAPEESKRVEDFDIRRKTGKSAPFFYETVGKNKKGQRLNIQVSISQISYHGKSAFLVVAQDVTKYKQAESELSGALEKVRVALGATVQAIMEIVEKRDPYTAGHQRRVADLGVAIASELEYPADQIEGIRMAGLLHDLGKISIPAEILTKPQKLSEAEYDLIKAHPKTAYDILRKIVFPWPVADIIHQHHERMNGSGYPQGLKDGEIVAEARILAVADVVEAMTTHRPYREAKRLEDALDEINQNKGVLYDSEAVDGCIRAFRSGDFEFKSLNFSKVHE
jgi:PAS domain S-box-containing protein/putative nucleotidyltransferase with HDIG domain